MQPGCADSRDGRPHINLKQQCRRSPRERLPLRNFLARGFFEQSLLEFFLALDAVAGPRHGLKALGVDLFAATDALTEVAFANARERSIDHH